MSALDRKSDDQLVELARTEAHGDTRPFEICGQRGVLKAITATQTLIEQDLGLVAIANTAFLDDTIRR